MPGSVSRRFLSVLLLGVHLLAACAGPTPAPNSPPEKPPATPPATAAGAAPSPPFPEDDAFLDSMGSSVVALEVTDERGIATGAGTAFFVADGVLVTCRHVLEGGARARIRFASEKTFPVQGVLWEDEMRDLALIAAGTPGAAPVPLALADADPAEGAPLVAVAPPLPGEARCIASYGRFHRRGTGEEDAFPGILLRMPLAPGWSGSPILDYSGAVAGVARGAVEGWYAVGIPADALRESMILSRGAAVIPLARRESRSGLYGNREPGRGPPTGRIPPAHLRPVLVEIALGRLEGADARLEVILKSAPNDADAREVLAFLREKQGRTRECIEALRKACELRPGDAETRGWLGATLLDAEFTEEAAKAYGESVRLDGSRTDTRYGLAFCLTRLGRHREALEAYREVLRLDPTYEAAQRGIDYSEAMLR